MGLDSTLGDQLGHSCQGRAVMADAFVQLILLHGWHYDILCKLDVRCE